MATSTNDPASTLRQASKQTAVRKNVRGEATRKRILSAAEQLFAEQGVAAASLRDVASLAGLRNHGAVQYHFGDRDGLVSAVMDRRGAESEEQRLSLLTGLMLDSSRPTVEDAVGAFVWPLALHLGAENHYLAFLSRMITEEGGYDWVKNVQVGGAAMSIEALLRKLIQDLPLEVLTERWWLAVTSSVHALARMQSAQKKDPRTTVETRVAIADLVTFFAAGIAAPLSENPKGPRG